jgi:hypothetical protein
LLPTKKGEADLKGLIPCDKNAHHLPAGGQPTTTRNNMGAASKRVWR